MMNWMRLSKSQPDSERILPLLPLNNKIVLPRNNTTMKFNSPDSIRSINEAKNTDDEIFLGFHNPSIRNPFPKDIYPIGTIALVGPVRDKNEEVQVFLEGCHRAEIKKIRYRNNTPWVHLTRLEEIPNAELEALYLLTVEKFKSYLYLYEDASRSKTIIKLAENQSIDAVISLVCDELKVPPEISVSFLQEKNDRKRLEELCLILQVEMESFRLKKKINNRVNKNMERSQKNFFLKEQLKEIHKELGNDPTGLAELEKKLLKMDLPDEAENKARTEFSRLSRIQSVNPEYSVLRTYLEWIIDLPWDRRTSDQNNLSEAARILDSEHFGLDEPKEHILDFIATKQMNNRLKSPILCLIGPPGTGKTSLGSSVAHALGRNFVRISLGGINDEAEIRGHRKTYVGALPGKIIQALKRAGSINPVFLLDEVDKISHDYRRDPSSALLEVLDPEQNYSFTDHYMELPFNLSEVLFIATANSLEGIPHPLRDRMEVIRLPGYTILEKKKIAMQFIIPKHIENNKMDNDSICFQEQSLDFLIRGYTQEAGVRNMERSIRQVIRKVVRKLIHDGQTRPGQWKINSAALHLNQTHSAIYNSPKSRKPSTAGFKLDITPELIREYLGKERLEDDPGIAERPGLASGLYYDGGGGGVLPVEALIFDGDEKLILTGQLGDVMKESAQIALSFLRAHKNKFGLKSDFDRDKTIHVHVPQGAIPVDGPSAGIALTAAILSAALQIPPGRKIAMTGEVTLTNRILPIGGVKEKILAAKRRGFTSVILPSGNKRDIDEMTAEVKIGISFIFHDKLDEALIDLFGEDKFPENSL